MSKKTISPAPTKKGFNLAAFSKSRDLLFGIATVMVIIFHSYLSFDSLLPSAPVVADILNLVRTHCNKGVDMFLFMSGIGLYYSMSSNPALKDFYKKRAVRILPPVLIVSAIWFAIKGSSGLGNYISNVTLLSFYTKGTRNFWYFSLIVVLYAVYPFIHKFYKKSGVAGFLLSVFFILMINFLLMKAAPSVYLNIEIALTRIPVFLFGCFAAKYVKEGVTISSKWLIIAAALTIGIYVLYFYMPLDEGKFLYLYRYIGSIFAVSQLTLWAALFEKTKRGGFATFLVWIGGYSMEIYLIHEKAASILYNSFHTNDPSKIAFYIAIAVVTIITAIALKAICLNLEKNLFFRNSGNKKP